jgi:uncharacterized protein (TIGR02265 family)
VVAAVDLPRARESVDLARRLSDLPANAGIRGAWFSTTSAHMRRLGVAEAMAWKRATRGRIRLPFLYYPLREYLDELAVAGVLTCPHDATEGMRRIFRGATPDYLSTPFGRTLLQPLRPNPVRYIKWVVDYHHHFCNYGSWSVKRNSDTHYTIEMKDEYVWIASAQRGGAEGLLATCGVEGTVEPAMTGPYSGRLHIRWQARPG